MRTVRVHCGNGNVDMTLYLIITNSMWISIDGSGTPATGQNQLSLATFLLNLISLQKAILFLGNAQTSTVDVNRDGLGQIDWLVQLPLSIMLYLSWQTSWANKRHWWQLRTRQLKLMKNISFESHAGRMRQHQWIFGGVECGTYKCFLVPAVAKSLYVFSPSDITRLGNDYIFKTGWSVRRERSSTDVCEKDVCGHDENFATPIDSEIHTQPVHYFGNLQKTMQPICNQSSYFRILHRYVARELL